MADGTKIFRSKPYREFVINVAVYEVVENPEYFDQFRLPTPVPPPKYLRVKVAESEGGRVFGTLELSHIRAQDRRNEHDFSEQKIPRHLGFMRWIAENLKATIHRIIVDQDNGLATMIKEHLDRTP